MRQLGDRDHPRLHLPPLALLAGALQQGRHQPDRQRRAATLLHQLPGNGLCKKKASGPGVEPARQVHDRQSDESVSCLGEFWVVAMSAELAWSSSGTSSTVGSSAHRLASRLRQAFMLLSAASGTVIVSAAKAAHRHLYWLRQFGECGSYGQVNLRCAALFEVTRYP